MIAESILAPLQAFKMQYVKLCGYEVEKHFETRQDFSKLQISLFPTQYLCSFELCMIATSTL